MDISLTTDLSDISGTTALLISTEALPQLDSELTEEKYLPAINYYVL